MNQSNDEDTTIKVSKEVLDTLKKKARPFESRKSCIERVIMQSCSPSKISDTESGTNMEEGDE